MTEAVINLTALLALTCNAASVGLAAALIGAPQSTWSDRIVEYASDGALALGGLIAVVATAGSLYFSEVADFIPAATAGSSASSCTRSRSCSRSPPGVGTSTCGGTCSPSRPSASGSPRNHYLLQRFPDLAGGSACDLTAPCTAAWVWKWDFVSIPYMAGSGFLLIGLLALATIRHRKEQPA